MIPAVHYHTRLILTCYQRRNHGNVPLCCAQSNGTKTLNLSYTKVRIYQQHLKSFNKSFIFSRFTFSLQFYKFVLQTGQMFLKIFEEFKTWRQDIRTQGQWVETHTFLRMYSTDSCLKSSSIELR